MPADIDNDRAIYARTPAWHKIGHVNEAGWFTAEDALKVLNPNNEPIIKTRVAVFFDGEWVEVDDYSGVVERDPEDAKTCRTLGINAKDYGLVSLEDQFRFLDEVVQSIDGAHYESAVRLRQGKQACLTIATNAIALDPDGRNDIVKKYICGFNSFDGSWAFRVKMVDFRVECANMAAAALRGSSNKIVTGDWSTRHSTNIHERVSAAKATLGLWQEYNDLFAAQAEEMLRTDLQDNDFNRLVSDLFTNPETLEKDEMAIEQTRIIYELVPGNQNIYGTVWGGLQAVTEHADWYTKVRGSKKTSADEMRFRKQMESPMKQQAWDMFSSLAGVA